MRLAKSFDGRSRGEPDGPKPSDMSTEQLLCLVGKTSTLIQEDIFTRMRQVGGNFDDSFRQAVAEWQREMDQMVGTHWKKRRQMKKVDP